VDLGGCLVGEWSEGSGLAEGAVRPVDVVVALVLAQHRCRMPLVDDEDAVKEFTANAADETFSDRIGTRGLHRRPDNAEVDRGEDGVDGSGELGIAVADEKPKATVGIVEVHEQVAGLLGQPGAGGMGGDAEDVHPAGGVLDDEERIQPAQGGR
jgi:hypothetical protein